MHACGSADRFPKAVISSCSDASCRRNSSGIYCEVHVTIDKGKDSTIIPETICFFHYHFPINDVDIAEALGVLLGMWHIWSHRGKIQEQMSKAGCTEPPSITLLTDRKSLLTSLPECKPFVVLRTMLEEVYDLKPKTNLTLAWEWRQSAMMRRCDDEANGAFESKIVTPLFLRLHEQFLRIIKTHEEWSHRLLVMDRQYLEESSNGNHFCRCSKAD